MEAIRAEIACNSDRDSCAALGVTANGSAPVLALCRKLVAAGHDPTLPLHAYRGDVLALRVRSIGEGARLRVSPHGVGFVWEAGADEQQPRSFAEPAEGLSAPTLH